MKHLSDEKLVVHYYNDDRGAARRKALDHLSGCQDCAARLAEFTHFLGAIPPLEPPERSEAYGNAVWNAIRGRLPEREKQRWHVATTARWAWGAAAAALIFAAFVLGRFSQPSPHIQTIATQTAPEKIKERVLLVALGNHLEKSQMVLIELANAPDDQGRVDISSEQERAQNLVDAGRLYRQTAHEVGDTSAAKVLDELERTLLDVVHSPSELSEADLKRIQQRIRSQELIFKVRIVGARVARERSPKENESSSPSQPTQPRKTT
jgi:hypothetical protein